MSIYIKVKLPRIVIIRATFRFSNMKYFLFILGFSIIAKLSKGGVIREEEEKNDLLRLFGELAKSMGEKTPNLLGKRCANLFDEGCNNGGLPGSGKDEEWITDPGNTPGKRGQFKKRCLNLFDEGCDNSGLPGSGRDEEWITGPGTPGKRGQKRCLNLFDEGCNNGGLPGSGKDEEWITDPGNTPGKRGQFKKRCLNLFDEGCDNSGLPGSGRDEEWITGPGTPGKRGQKRCLNLFDEGCNNGGLPGSGKDEEWITGPGTPGKRGQKRCLNLFDEGCNNGGLPGSGKDEEWITDPGNTPGKRGQFKKRCLNLFDEGCNNSGLPGSGRDEEWITGPGTPGKRSQLYLNRLQHLQRFGVDPRLLNYNVNERGDMRRGARCANLFNEGCDMGGVVGGGRDQEIITNPSKNPGKRNMAF